MPQARREKCLAIRDESCLFGHGKDIGGTGRMDPPVVIAENLEAHPRDQVPDGQAVNGASFRLQHAEDFFLHAVLFPYVFKTAHRDGKVDRIVFDTVKAPCVAGPA